jgi:hypothetical protein
MILAAGADVWLPSEECQVDQCKTPRKLPLPRAAIVTETRVCHQFLIGTFIPKKGIKEDKNRVRFSDTV